MTEVPFRDYLDAKLEVIVGKIDALTISNEGHFKANELGISRNEITISKTAEITALKLESINNRLNSLEMARSFSSGKMWMVMALFAGIPTVLAVIALFMG